MKFAITSRTLFDASFSFICASRRQSRTDAAQTEVLKLDDPPYNSLTAGSSILAFPKVKIACPSSPSQTSISAPDKILSLYLHSLHKRLLVRDQNVRPPPGKLARATLKVSLGSVPYLRLRSAWFILIIIRVRLGALVDAVAVRARTVSVTVPAVSESLAGMAIHWQAESKPRASGSTFRV